MGVILDIATKITSRVQEQYETNGKDWKWSLKEELEKLEERENGETNII